MKSLLAEPQFLTDFERPLPMPPAKGAQPGHQLLQIFFSGLHRLNLRISPPFTSRDFGRMAPFVSWWHSHLKHSCGSANHSSQGEFKATFIAFRSIAALGQPRGLFQNVQQCRGTIKTVAPCSSHLLNNSKPFQSLNRTLCCCKCNSKLFSAAFCIDKRIRPQQFEHS